MHLLQVAAFGLTVLGPLFLYPRLLPRPCVESGEIDFDEFLTVMNSPSVGGGGLADVAGSAANFFGIANPFTSWMGGDKKE